MTRGHCLRIGRGWGWALIAVVFSLLAALSPAQAQDVSLQQFLHTRWTTRDGAPPSILALAQTSDGVLWLGTPAGLYTFNGYEFRPFHQAGGQELPSLGVASLEDDGQGGLWVGLWFGGIAHISDGGFVVIYRAQGGVHPGNVQQIVADKEGTAWAIAGNELIRFDGHKWHSFGPSEGNSTNDQHGVDSIYLEPNGVLWVMFGERLYRVRPGGTSLEATQERSFLVMALRRAPDGQMWLADRLNGIRRACPEGCRDRVTVKTSGPTGMVVDPSGDLWVSSIGGILRIHPRLLGLSNARTQPEKSVERFSSAQGLTSDRAECVLRDREGNIWAGTRQGLDRFQRSAFTPYLNTSQEQATSLAADARGTIWFGNHRIGLNAVDARNTASIPVSASRTTRTPDGRRSFMIASGVDDTLLVSNNSGLFRFQSPDHLRPLPGLQLARDFPILAMAEDRYSGIFVSLARNGVWRLWEGKWSRVETRPGISDTAPMSLSFDERHRLWMGCPSGRIEILDPAGKDGSRQLEEVSLGIILTISRMKGTMWVGGASGIAWSDGVTLHPVHALAAESLRGISGIVQAADGSFWLNGAAGVSRVAAEEMEHARIDADYRFRSQLFDYRDGLEGVALQWDGRPTAARDGEGHLWFSTTSGLFSIDPLHLPINTVPPSVRVTGVQMDDARLQASSTSIVVPPGIHTVRINYEGVSLTSPDRVVYRYKLDGEDKDWQNGGSRREAVYTRLHPGTYTFYVMAANASGIWSSREPRLAMLVKPAFYQTTWFRFACLAAGCALLWLIYQWRVRFVIARVEERLDERARERVRIARDLHDTLLQGIQGLVLRFHFAAEQVPADQPAHALLSQALSRADQVISEGRDRVTQLRGQPSSTDELLKAILDAAENQRWDRPVEIRVLAEGESRPLRALVHDELYAIGREAVTNALRHASPSRVEIELISHANELRLRCRDNGIGMPANGSQRSHGHWGILGMEERAARLGARFDLWSSPGAGTEIEVRVRAAAAYAVSTQHAARFSLSHLFVHSEE